MDYTVILKPDIRQKEHKYIEPKLKMPFNTWRLHNLLTFQENNQNNYRLLLILEIDIEYILQADWFDRILMNQRLWGISIILILQTLQVMPSRIFEKAEYFFVSMTDHNYKKSVKIVSRQSVTFDKDLLEQAVALRDRVFLECDDRFSFLLCQPSERLMWTNPGFLNNRKDYPKSKFLLPSIHIFLTHIAFYKCWNLQNVYTDELDQDHLKQLVDNYLNFRASRSYARLLLRDTPTTKCPNMAQLQSFFQCNPGVLKFIGTKLLLFGFYH